MKLSARNQIPGTIHAVKPGATTTHVTIDIAGGRHDHSFHHQRSRRGTGLKTGMKAFAV